MPHYDEKNSGPLVNVLIPTFNRPGYLYKAIASALGQIYRNIQIIVVNDGGHNVSDIINSFNDERLIFINRKDNRGKPFSLNQALSRAEGKYIAYLDDDDIYYPNHIGSLVYALENQTDCQAAYSDLYKVICNTLPDGRRKVLAKELNISRDFDRLFMLLFNHVLHVSLMHRRDLIDKTGSYNEQLDVMIDWDMTRRLTFFTDFHHIYEITGEYYQPQGDCDRISVRQRKNRDKYLRNILTIRTTRPAKPWSKIKDMSIIFTTQQFDKLAGDTIKSIWHSTFYPYMMYLPLPESDIARLKTDMPNLTLVPVDPFTSSTGRLDASLERCEGEYITIVPNGYPVKSMWVENSLYALINNPSDNEVIELEESTDNLWAAVTKKDVLLHARKSFPDLPVRDSLIASGARLRKADFKEYPFQFDNLLTEARTAQQEGNWHQAAEIFQFIEKQNYNELWMKKLTARALYKSRDYNRAAELCRQINTTRPTVETLLLEAKILKDKNGFNNAITLLEEAECIINCGSEI